jgi:integrase
MNSALWSRWLFPLQAKALEALDRLPPSENQILFPNARGGRIDFRSYGRRHWKPAQKAAAIEPLRDLYDLRHTYATFALRAGVPVFAVSRFMGSSSLPRRISCVLLSHTHDPYLLAPRLDQARTGREQASSGARGGARVPPRLCRAEVRI